MRSGIECVASGTAFCATLQRRQQESSMSVTLLRAYDSSGTQMFREWHGCKNAIQA